MWASSNWQGSNWEEANWAGATGGTPPVDGDDGIVIGEFITVGVRIAVGARTSLWDHITSRRTVP